MQMNFFFAFSFLVLSLICYAYDVRLHTRQRMAKFYLLLKYQRKFAPYNVHIERREINHFHSWLGISVRQYVYVFLPIQPETCSGETQPTAKATSEIVKLMERDLDEECEALFVAVQNKRW
jgi:hypothetical protein